MGKGKINYFTVIIAIMGIAVAVELVVILNSIFSIKKENIVLIKENRYLKKTNTDLSSENKLLKDHIFRMYNPVILPPGIKDGLKLYRCLDYGFEVAYPEDYKADIGGDHSPAARPELLGRVSIYSDSEKPRVDIDIVSADTYKDIKDYVKTAYNHRLYVKRAFYANNKKLELYKLSGQKNYHVVLGGRDFIYDISSGSEELLVKIIANFKFI